VTHPFHPLYTQEFELVQIHKAWGEARVLLRGSSGVLSLPAAWTDALPSDAFVLQAAGRSALRMQDLLSLVQLVRDLDRHEV
jgi:hypothetical protein